MTEWSTFSVVFVVLVVLAILAIAVVLAKRVGYTPGQGMNKQPGKSEEKKDEKSSPRASSSKSGGGGLSIGDWFGKAFSMLLRIIGIILLLGVLYYGYQFLSGVWNEIENPKGVIRVPNTDRRTTEAQKPAAFCSSEKIAIKAPRTEIGSEPIAIPAGCTMVTYPHPDSVIVRTRCFFTPGPPGLKDQGLDRAGDGSQCYGARWVRFRTLPEFPFDREVEYWFKPK